MSVEVRNVSKLFGGFRALDDVSLTVATGELVALLGPSGSGKTTLLRIIGGLLDPDGGSVWLDGEDATARDARERGVGFVFQSYALFRHMTVFDNIAFGLKVRKNRPSRREIEERVRRLLSLMQLDGFEKRRPSQLSGGQRQRVALARALAVEPKVLLLDEPFGALDAQVRRELRRWLRRLHDEMHVTGIFVTHDQDEALDVADRVVVMNAGALEQTGTPIEIYDQPRTPFVYQFIGSVNRLSVPVADGAVRLGTLSLAVDGGPVHGNHATVFFRPHATRLVSRGAEPGIPAIVRHVSVLGAHVRVDLTADGQPFEVELPRQGDLPDILRPGAEVTLVPLEPKIFRD
ncbi:MAG: sulfate/molybdate ABC transporter ATP-binding protein [Alphaproteobacteria bacterium]